MKHYIKALQHYADFTGRASRKEFWYFVLFNFLFAILVLLIDLVAGWDIMSSQRNSLIPFYGPSYLTFIFVTFLPGLAVGVRRLHDINKSGWWILIGLIPLVGAIWLIVLMCTDGKNGKNSYGINPKEFTPGYSEYKRLKSLSIVFIVGGAFLLIDSLLQIVSDKYFGERNMLIYFAHIINYLLIIIFGIFLHPVFDSLKMNTRKRKAMLFLGFATFIQLFIAGYYCIKTSPGIFLIWNIIGFLGSLSFLVLIILILQKGKQKIITTTGIILIIFSAFIILINIVSVYKMFVIIQPPTYATLYVGIVLFAIHHFPRKHEDVEENLPATFSEEDIPVTENKQVVVEEKSPSLGWIIFNFLASIFLIWGGLSGNMVLRGTESSTALVIVGILYFLYDIFSLTQYIQSKSNTKDEVENDINENQENNNENSL